MSGNKIEIVLVNQKNMEKHYDIKTTEDQTLRVKAVRGTTLFATKWYWDIYILEGFFNTTRYLAKTEDEALIPETIRANIYNVSSINPIKF
jgi:hypothetical protein